MFFVSGAIIVTKFPLLPSNDLERLTTSLSAGGCCSIVGLSNTGKSTLLRAVCEPDVFKPSSRASSKPSGNRALADTAIFYIDCNAMLTMSEQGFYEATLRAVQAEMGRLSALASLVERVENLYRKVVEPSSAFVVPLSFNESVIVLCEQLGRRVVFLFDEFDDPFARLDGRVFLNLRALRDKYGERLCFVTATDGLLAETRSDAEASEFSELFAGHTYFLKMFAPDLARRVVAEFMRGHAVTLGQEEMDFILQQAGGHPGLLLAAASVLVDVLSSAPTDLRPPNLTLARQLLDRNAAVRNECARLWAQLGEDDQVTLLNVLTQSEPFASTVQSAWQRLVERGILQDKPSQSPEGLHVVFSPLFETFARRQFRARLPPQSGIYVDVDSGEVWADGRKIPTLTDLEYRLLLLLYGRIDKICDKYQVVEAVWGQEFIDDVDDSRVEKLISRLRQKLEHDPANPRYFQTVRGRGYRLISG